MSLKNKDTPENRAYWERVEAVAREWERVKPEWVRRVEAGDAASDGPVTPPAHGGRAEDEDTAK